MLSSTSPYHFSRPAIYQMFVGRRTDKGMCLTLSFSDNWTQYAVTLLFELLTVSFSQLGLNLPKIIFLHLATFVWLWFMFISVALLITAFAENLEHQHLVKSLL